jgi:hypothetical protein
MSALRKILVVENEVAVNEVCNRVLPTKPYVAFRAEHAHETLDRLHEAAPAVATTRPAAAEAESHLKNIALFAVAPFIGLAYAVLLPFVGLGWLVVMAIKALAAKPITRAALIFIKIIALFVAAPFVGLLYVVMLPFVGATMFAWVGAKALMTRTPG